MQTLAEKIAIMQAAERGEKIECRDGLAPWRLVDDPKWDWLCFDYRVAPKEITIYVFRFSKNSCVCVSHANPIITYGNNSVEILSTQTITY